MQTFNRSYALQLFKFQSWYPSSVRSMWIFGSISRHVRIIANPKSCAVNTIRELHRFRRRSASVAIRQHAQYQLSAQAQNLGIKVTELPDHRKQCNFLCVYPSGSRSHPPLQSTLRSGVFITHAARCSWVSKNPLLGSHATQLPLPSPASAESTKLTIRKLPAWCPLTPKVSVRICCALRKGGL